MLIFLNCYYSILLILIVVNVCHSESKGVVGSESKKKNKDESRKSDFKINSSNKKGGRVYLHVGPHKTASTYIQSVLTSEVNFFSC